jgi:RND superfamily putative drug exporter
VIAAVVGVAVLVALAIPLLSLRLGEPRTSTLAKAGDARVALDTLTDGGVPAGVLTPIEVLVKGDPVATTAKLAAVKGVLTTASPNTPGFRRDGTAVVDVLPVAEAGQGAGRATVRAVRAALVGDPEAIGVGGVGAQSIDAVHAIYGSFPLMLTLIAIVTFLLLARALRSVLLALKAVLVNLLSVAAAYGVLVLVWQDGHGSNTVWGVASTGVITFWVPVFVFAFLFGLSMDYEVFILTRIREGYDRTGSTALATVEGLARTGRLVTSAALILAFAFLAMSTGPQTDMKILATGLGAGIVVDAFVVRTLVVPALVALFGRWNWWLPAALARLLRVAPSAAMEEPSAVPSSTIPSQPVGGSRVPG